jgi:4-hydroxy-tetrahydrodipicolinate synthase
MGRTALGYRLPLVELGAEHHETVRRALQDADLL